MVDLVPLHTASSAFIEVDQLLSTTISVAGRVELEWPQEVGGGLEVGAHSEDFVDEVLDAHDVVLAKGRGNHLIRAERNALSAHLAKSTLVDELSYRLQVGVPVGNEGLDQVQHLLGGSVDADKHAVVDLAQTEELQDLLHLG